MVYVGSADEYLYTLDLTMGERLWPTDQGSSVGTVVATDGRRFFALEDGTLVAMAPPE